MTSGTAFLEANADEPVSPELVLIDPELARRVRARMPHPSIDSQHALNGDGDGDVDVDVDVDVPAYPLWVAPSPAPAQFTAGTAAAPVDAGFERQTASLNERPSGRPLYYAFVAGAVFGVVALLGGNAVRHWTGAQSSLRADAVPQSSARLSDPSNGRTRERPPPSNQAPATSQSRPALRNAQVAPKRFVWVPDRRATYYDVQFFRNGIRILHVQTGQPGLTLAARWTYGGRQYSLSPGRYRWVVRPGFGARRNSQLGTAIVRSSLVVKT